MSYYKYDGSVAAETMAPGAGFYGTAGVVDTYSGTAAAESFWGGDGDLMAGGSGDDTYYLKSGLDRVVEMVGGGTDKIVAWSNVYLPGYANIENLEVNGDGTYGAGGLGDNVIQGGAGAQQLYGGLGQDILIGGAGADTFIIIKGEGNDVIQDFSASAGDLVRLKAGYSTFAQVQSHLSQAGADVRLDLGGGDGVLFRNATTSQFSAANFQLQLDPATLGRMTFADEFSGKLSLWDAESNPSGVWRPDFGYQGSQGVGSYSLVSNDEKQIYTSPYFRDHNGDFASPFTSNADGALSITARAVPAGGAGELFGYGYTSGMISTAQSFAQTYGYFEMRAELPHAAGAWPAFWLIPADGSWPPELDVMETLSSDPHADWTTAHSGLGGHTANGVASFVPDTADGFHTYGVLWTKTDLTWYVDGVEVFHQATPADMNKPMFMIANLAVGGWGGAVDTAALPATMKIDFIHAYALPDGSSITAASATGTATSPPPVVAGDPSAGLDLHSPGFGAILTGGAGADTLTSFHGNETMTGGAGADRFVFGALPWNPTHIKDFQAGVDKLDLSGLYIDGYHGSDPVADGYVSFVPDGLGGTKVVVDVDGRATGHPWPDYVANLDGVAPGGLTAANVLWAPIPAPAAVPAPVGVSAATSKILRATGSDANLQGGAGDDTISAESGSNYLRGGDGADAVQGGSGFDDINGNQGDDTAHGAAGADWVVGGRGDDRLFGDDDNDLVLGNLGADTLDGGRGDDVLRGGQNDDMLFGGDGDDWLSGDRGADTLTGGAGADTFHSFFGAGVDRVTDFRAGEGDRIQLDPGTTFTIIQSGADTVVDLGNGDLVILANVQLASLPTGWIFVG